LHGPAYQRLSASSITAGRVRWEIEAAAFSSVPPFFRYAVMPVA
jgi:hypothetical protein